MELVSAVIITYNEEQNLQLSLPMLTWCDEIIVVDSGSTDNTIKICREYGCKIYYRKFEGYGSQKQYAVSLAKNKWVLCLDADEVLTDALVNEIQETMKHPTAEGYLIPMILVFLGKKFRYGKESWRYFLRLFNKEAGCFNNRIVHEGVVLSGTRMKLKNNIFHYSYSNISQYFNKFNRYSSYSAEIAWHEGRKRSLLAILFALPVNFFKYYIIERNFLNGISGFYWSCFNAFYHFVKYIKIKELYKNTEEEKRTTGTTNLHGVDLLSDDLTQHTNL